MYRPTNPPLFAHRPVGMRTARPGFALMVALSLMGFIVLLLFSLSTMTRLQTQTASNGTAAELARQNALVGMQVAMGQLQKLAGHDQRVTATADFLATAQRPTVTTAYAAGTGRSYEGSLNISNKHWTGIWRHAGEAFTDEPGQYGTVTVSKPELVNWLISGNEVSPTYTPEKQLQGDAKAPLVQLVGEKTLGAGNQAEYVAVPLRQISSPAGVTGGYAYWVGDEGVKAKFNVVDPNKGATAPTGYKAEPRNSTRLALRTGPDKLTGLANLNPNDPRLLLTRRVQELGMVNKRTSVTTSAKQHFHDLTGYSKGVLSDMRLGGLKKDLTAGLQPTAFGVKGPVKTGSATADSPIFPPQAAVRRPSALSINGIALSATQQDPGGPDWRQLRDYVNLSGQVSGSRANATVRFREPSDTQHGVFPVMTQFQMGYHVTFASPIAAPTDTHVLNAYVLPVIALWNPYTVPMRIDTDLYAHAYMTNLKENGLYAAVWDESVKPTASLRPKTPGTFASNGVPSAPNYTKSPWVSWKVADNTFPRVFSFRLDTAGVTIPAGQALFFAPNSQRVYNLTNGSSNVLVRSNMPGAYGFKLPMS